MEEFVVYILKSEKYLDKIYIGFTSDLIGRIQSHNIYGTKGHTIRFRPWKVEYVRFFSSKSEAMMYEKFLKSGIGRKYIHIDLGL